jgi:16S rRNA (guanine966-N2)-methyltransferase
VRVVAGEFRGRLLKTLPGRDVRPTSDRLRETLFNVLRNDVPGAVFLDCYAGSGAVGIEAASRGAAEVYLIEQDPAAARVIERNIAALHLAGTVRLMHAEIRGGLRRLIAQGIQADLCFCDPPYASLPEALKVLEWAVERPLMRHGGMIILEHGGRDSTPLEIGRWRRARLLEQGSSALSFYRTS